MPYKRFRLDMTAVIDTPRELVPRNRTVTEVFMMPGDLPVGKEIGLQFGQDADSIAIREDRFSFGPSKEDGNSGLYWTNPVASPGSVAILYVGVESKEQEPGARETTAAIPKVRQPGFSH